MQIECLLDEMEDIVFVCDSETYHLLYLNRAGIKRVNTKKEQYQNFKCYELLQGESAPCPFCPIGVSDYGKDYIWEHTNRLYNRHYILKDRLIDWNGKKAHMQIAIDITEKETISRGLENKLEIENALINCIQTVTGIYDIEKAMEQMLKLLAEFYGAEKAYIAEVESDKKYVKTSYQYGSGAYCDEEKIAYNPDCEKYFQNNSPIIIMDLEQIEKKWKKEYQYLLERQVKRIFMAPFCIKNSNRGFIALYNPQAHLQDTSLLDSLCYFMENELTKRRMHQELEFMLYYDTLTKLPNRHSYLKYINAFLPEQVASIGIIIADINGLKKINESYGHKQGDRFVCITADILKRIFNKEQVFRLDGDEFAVICENIARENFILKICDAKAKFEASEYYGVSLGHTWTDDDIDLKKLEHHANELMYINKQSYYKNSDTISKHNHPQVLSELLELIDRGNFLLYLQPKMDIATQKLVSAEALVRMYYPKKGIIFPDRFIPVLEKDKLIRYIDFFIYEQVLKTLSQWIHQGITIFPVSLNFSRITVLETNLIETMLSISKKYKVPHQYIEIEITETIGEMEQETIAEIGQSLKRHGFRISLDDFGAKYTNMSMLTLMNFDVLKLDRSIICNLTKNKTNQIVIRNIINMCREMRIQVVAEGIETKDQLDFLKELHCDVGQGYYFDKPLALEQFIQKYLDIERMD